MPLTTDFSSLCALSGVVCEALRQKVRNDELERLKLERRLVVKCPWSGGPRNTRRLPRNFANLVRALSRASRLPRSTPASNTFHSSNPRNP